MSLLKKIASSCYDDVYISVSLPSDDEAYPSSSFSTSSSLDPNSEAFEIVVVVVVGHAPYAPFEPFPFEFNPTTAPNLLTRPLPAPLVSLSPPKSS